MPACIVYRAALLLLPWGLLAGTAGFSLAFNFATTFGLSVSSPLVVSLATQLGIPLNLLIDVLINPGGLSAGGALDIYAITGVALLLGSFTLSTAAEMKNHPSTPISTHDDDGHRGRVSSKDLLGPSRIASNRSNRSTTDEVYESLDDSRHLTA